MNLSIVKKDIKRNTSINVVLLLFITLSAFLMSVATMIIIQVFGSIDSMYKVAKPPHFMQMHVGEIDQQEIDQFAEGIDYVEDWQTIEMNNIYGGSIWVIKEDGSSFSMSDSLLDMGWVKQNEQYDLLLDMDNQPLHPGKGNVGVPLILLEEYDIEIGDTVTIKNGDYSKNFVVSSYVRDSQMNTTMASSTRFLINEEDFKDLKANTGEIEYLIEFYFNDPSQASKFQTEYEQANLPANGQAITYAIIRLISGLSDMMMAIVLVLVSFSLVFVVFLCLRFTILAAMEEEIKSIGTMKAIGMTTKNIRQLYMMKYRMLAILGCSLGYILSIFSTRLFTSHIKETFGAPKVTTFSIIVPILTVLIVYSLEVHFSKRVLKKIKRISVIEALISGGTQSHKKGSNLSRYMPLTKMKTRSVDLALAIKQVLVKIRTWFVILFVMAIATSIVLIPVNLLNTFDSPDFITYMGQSRNDIVISVNQSESLKERYKQISTILSDDEDVKDYSVEARVVYEAINKDEEWINIHVDHSQGATELQYLEGNSPKNDNEIALSLMNSREMEVNVGESLPMKINGTETTILVTGVYQDVTSGGYTAKMVRPYTEESVERYSFFVNVKDDVAINNKVDTYSNKFGMDVKVTDMEEFVDQTLGGVTAQLAKAVYAVALLSLLLIALITVLFLKLQTAKEYSQIAIMKAIGFSVLDIRKQYLVKVVMVTFVGILIGTVFANTLGEYIVSALLGMIGLGISNISFIINPLVSYLLFPIAIFAIVILVTWYSTESFKKYRIIELINE
ncbi:ABC transporter permease [Haloplasma contractile]|uniref:Macrolide transport system ATP-binding-permease protein n=1 Tax=Haloplasma contractile SSD-17B TaxID=1033810 RepID=U2FI79_9MOLU|nr:ABC transporter permease [Haloplasma contractile]ERJ10929.1 macrolide transport system ATP-binding-permease protein [Haloplasma contractile SSD-17B]